MKITILNTYDISGGAARAMYRLHQGLRSIDQDSMILSTHKQSNDETAVELDPIYRMGMDKNNTPAYSALVQDCISSNRTPLTNTIFSFPYPDWDVSMHPRILESDIINLHWVAYFQSARTIEKLLATGKSIVWTLHDEWAFTGGCHYTAGCNGFLADCKNCPQINIPNSTFANFVLGEKLQAFQDRITIVTPSKWLGAQARESALFRNSRIEVIPNSLDTNTFRPTPKPEAKASWNISTDTFTMLFGAENGNERRKGFLELLDSLKILQNNGNWRSAVESGKIRILIFGSPAGDIKELGIPFTSLGHIKDDNLLAHAYSSADLFVLPSLEDNLPNTMLESLSCGTPIVVFRAGGMPDMVIPGKTGWLAEFPDPSSLADKILEAFENSEVRQNLGANGRRWMEEEFHLPVQAKKYTSLFEELLNTASTKASGKIKAKDLSHTNISYSLPEPILEDTFQNSRELLLHGYIQYKRLQSLENYASTRAQIFFAENGEFDYTKGVQTTIPTSTVLSRFQLTCRIDQVVNFSSNSPFTILNPTGATILPSLRNPFEISIDKINLLLKEEKKFPLSLDEIMGNWTVRKEQYLKFYHEYGLLQLSWKRQDVVGVELSGRWRALTSWEAFEGLEGFLAEKDRILNSRVNRTSIKIGNVLIAPVRWVLGKRKA